MSADFLAKALEAHKAGDWAKAEELYRSAIREDPKNADAFALLGTVLSEQKIFDEAIAFENEAIALDPTSGLLHFYRGNVLMAAGKIDEAIDAFHQAVKLEPKTPQFHFNLGNALSEKKDWKKAVECYRAAIRIHPDFVEALNNLSLALIHVDAFDEAFEVAQKAVTLNPAYGDGWISLCNAAEKTKNYDAALRAGERAIKLSPNDYLAWFGYGVALNRVNRDLDALNAYKNALELNPKRANIWDNLAQTYQSLNLLEEAEKAFRKTIEADEQTIENEQGRDVEEEEYGDRHWHLALLELLRGKYKEGFARYRARRKAIPQLKRPNMPFPLWKGEDLRGKRILIHDEQGFGDTLMLARFLPLLKAQGAEVIFRVHKVLEPLFQNWDGVNNVITHDAPISSCDFFCSSFDLPHRLGTTLETLPNQMPYLPVLAPDEATTLPESKFKVGVVWGGSPLHLNDKKRSIPLELFAKLFSFSDATFYSFNRDLKEGDQELLPRYPVKDLAPALNSFGTSARLIGQMDLIITCDTATAHLAGGLGKHVWVLLPFAPDWRWLIDRDDCPWYPAMRLFRQPKPGDWESVIDSVLKAL